jgi:hypothetical protein
VNLETVRRSALFIAIVACLIVYFSDLKFSMQKSISDAEAAVFLLILAAPWLFEFFCCISTNIAITKIGTINKSENPSLFLIAIVSNVLLFTIPIIGAIYLA